MAFTRALLVASLLTAVAPAAWAQDDASNDAPASEDGTDKKVARENFQAGTKAYRNKDYLVAARAFEVAHRLAPHPFAVYNAGIAWDDGGRPGRAADDLVEALAMGELEPKMTEDAQSRLERLRKAVGVVSVEAPPGAKLDLGHITGGSASRAVHLPPGTYSVRVTYANGQMDEREVTVEVGKTEALTFELQETKPAEPAPVRVTPPDDVEADPMGLYIGGGISLGLGVLAGAAAIGLGVTALSARDTFVESGNTDADARDEAATLRTVTNVMWIVAGVGAVTGVTLFTVGAVSGGGDEGVEAEVQATPTGLMLRGRF